jgi:hypothetical protein
MTSATAGLHGLFWMAVQIVTLASHDGKFTTQPILSLIHTYKTWFINDIQVYHKSQGDLRHG